MLVQIVGDAFLRLVTAVVFQEFYLVGLGMTSGPQIEFWSLLINTCSLW
jgi:hypothetical protein